MDQGVQAAVARFSGTSRAPGLSIAIVNRGRESYYNYGEVQAGGGKLPTSDTVFEIGSITKTMTGLLVARAVKDGKLNLDTDIRRYLPGDYPNLQFEGKPILLRHLVTHSSGLPGNPPGIPDDGKADAYERYDRQKLLADLASIKLVRAPGAEYGYSNMGAGLCGPILEGVYGQPYESLLHKYVFAPARMESSGISLSPGLESRYATPHDASGVKTDRWTVNGIDAAGAVRSSARDMLRFARMELNERDPAIALSHSIQSPVGLTPFGVFWMKQESRLGGTYVTHEGGTGGFTSNILVMPKKQLAIVVLMNGGDQRADVLAREIALMILNP
jgi:CubicO group peptidase (beta-lactamase class C family)